MKKLTQIALGVLVALTIACDKKGSDPAPAAPPTSNFNYVNGQCYDTSVNQPTAATNCGHIVINGSYRWNGSTCIDAANVAVAQTFCNMANTTGNYRMIGTTCTDLNNQPVPQQYCTSMGANSQFQIVNGNCIATVTGQWVNSSYCAGMTGYNANQCNGIYVKFNKWGVYYTKYCQGNSCSGQTLMDYNTGLMVTCQ